MNEVHSNYCKRVSLFSSRTAIAGATFGLLLVLYNSKLSFLKDLFTHFYDFKSNWSSDFGHAETGSGAKKPVVLRPAFFSSNFESRVRKRCLNKNSLSR